MSSSWQEEHGDTEATVPEGKWSGSWQKEKLRILKRYENLTDLDILSEEICHLNRNMYLNENEQTKNIIVMFADGSMMKTDM